MNNPLLVRSIKLNNERKKNKEVEEKTTRQCRKCREIKIVTEFRAGGDRYICKICMRGIDRERRENRKNRKKEEKANNPKGPKLMRGVQRYNNRLSIHPDAMGHKFAYSENLNCDCGINITQHSKEPTPCTIKQYERKPYPVRLTGGIRHNIDIDKKVLGALRRNPNGLEFHNLSHEARLDKRTLNNSLKRLVNAKKIKIVKLPNYLGKWVATEVAD
jgi:hypothetical protein